VIFGAVLERLACNQVMAKWSRALEPSFATICCKPKLRGESLLRRFGFFENDKRRIAAAQRASHDMPI
jgi:hypothetical protein